MRKRHRQHLNPLKMTALVAREAPLELPPGRPVEVELGCGDARFTIERAGHRPEALCVGLDIRELFLQDARELQAEAGVDNVHLEASNFLVDIDRLFEPGRVDRFFVNFPDPWFKRRQRNRRWLTAEAIDHMARALVPGGELFFQSDVWDITIETFALLEACEALRNTRGPWTFHGDSPFEARSTREVICTDEGKQIWRLLFKKNVK